MMRNLKALGLALVAVFAMSAMAASAAQAEPTFTGYNTKTEKDVTTTVTGSQTAANPLKFHEIKKTEPAGTVKELGGTVECEEANFHGHLETGSSKELTLTPTFGGPNTQTGCTALGLPATVTTEGCTFRFNTLTKTEETMTYDAKADLVCPAGKSVIVHAFADKEHKIPVCTLIVEPGNNQGLTGIDAHVNTEKPTDLKVTVNTVVQYRTEGTCGKANKEATYTGEVTLKGYEATKVGEEIKETEQIDLDING